MISVEVGAKLSPDALASGRRALAEARWEDARADLERALAGDETIETLEALTAAAWWMNDDERVFSLRERTFHLYRERGEPGPAARTAAWLAWDCVSMAGNEAAANGWLRRAWRLVDGLDPDADSGWVAAHEAGIAFMGSDLELARRRGAEAARLGRVHRVPDLEMLGLSLEGMGLVAQGDVAAGMERLDEGGAVALAGEAEVLSSIGRACCYVIDACEQVRDYERAEQWCRHGLEFSSRNRVPHLFGRCRGHYGEVLMWRGEWDEAERWLERSIAECERTRPPLAARSYVRLAELRRRQGRLGEAAELLGRAGTAPAAILGRARIALDGGDGVAANELVERYLRRVPEHLRLIRADGLEVAVRVQLACGRAEQAADAAHRLERVATAVATTPLRAHAHLAHGMVLAAAGEHGRARPRFEDAIDAFAEAGAPYEAALARLELAAALAAAGRPEPARDEVREAAAALNELGAVPAADGAEALLARLDGRNGERHTVRDLVPGLTARESEVIDLVAAGLTNREIAERLVLSEHTVHRHMTNLLRKLEVSSRAAAVARAGELRGGARGRGAMA